ncbi:MAG TPA: tetratricopeptide repeat protein [Burkholderiaceae bacterium]
MFKNLLNRILPSPAPAPAPAPAPTPTPAPAARETTANDIAAADALIVQGNALEDAGMLPRAEALYRAAVEKAPGHARAHLNLGIVLAAQGDDDGAIAAYERVLAIDPAHPFGNYNYARLLVVRGDNDRAETLAAQALRARPDFPQATELLARILRDQGFAREALVPLRSIIERDPANWLHRSFELLVMNSAGDDDADAMFRRHVQFGAGLEQAVPPRFAHHPERGDPARRLRVGYLGSDFLLHPVAFFLIPVLEHHDRTQVEVFCYSSETRRDGMTDRIQDTCDHWREVAALSDDALADLIHADGIDVLVDLIGHTGIPRLGVFCQRPAPVQVEWLGYLNTTGLTRMDFRLSDERADPPAISQPRHTERLVSMPASQWCYRAMVDQDIEPAPPFERNGHLTFGSFNAAIKITPAACRRWAQVLLRVPGSRLVIGDINSGRKRAAIRRDIEGEGVAADRVEFMPRVGFDKYLGLYNAVDITFDTFPYGGGTTTFDSLWMGVPVVAAVGDTPVSRSAASILAALGLDDWIAPDADRFVDLAVARASDLEALRTLRRDLRPRLQASPLTDLPRYTRDLEAAWRRMWLDRTA